MVMRTPHPRVDGIPVALPIGPEGEVDHPYWEGLRDGVLRIQCCAACGQWIWAPSWVCPSCFTFDPPWQDVDPQGAVYSWTRTHHAFPAAPEFHGHTPYDIVLVELTAAGHRRLLGIGVGFDEPPRLGDPVTGVIQPASDRTGGWPVLRWAPSSTGNGAS